MMMPCRLLSLLFPAIASFLCTACLPAQELRPGSGWLRPGESRPLSRPVRVLLAGDSLMEGLGPRMCDALSGYGNLTLIPIGKKSTGLCRSDFYDWPRVLQQRLAADKPHLVVMWIGTNDTQGIYGMSGLGEPCSREWQIAYLGKVREIFELVRRYKARLILMGPPVVGDPKLNEQLFTINRLMAWACKKYGVCYVDTRIVLGDARGRFQMQGPLPNGQVGVLRTPDRLHITADGYKRVMHYLLPYVGEEIRRCFGSGGSSAGGASGRRGGTSISGKPAGRR